MSHKILTILGARPQFVKAAVLSKAFAQFPEIVEVLVHTGQHYDHSMSGSFFKELGLAEPAYNLGVQEASNQLAVASMLKSLEKVFSDESPDLVLVYGDTNSTLAGALAAKFHGVPLAHVEAGMRIGDLSVPEELNRVVADRLSHLLFCSSEDAVHNLEKEGFKNSSCKIAYSGDVMYDSFLTAEAASMSRTFLLPEDWKGKYILASLHRAETVDNEVRLRSVISALNTIGRTSKVVVPMHPRTKKRVQEFNIQTDFKILDAVPYPDMLNLIRHSTLVMTDSGGLQKEAFFSKKTCVVLREKTEWTELEKGGYVVTAGFNSEKIISECERMRNVKLSFHEQYYGNGHAGEKIANDIMKYLQG